MTLTETTYPSAVTYLHEYAISQQLYAGSRTIVYRAVEKASQRCVIIKLLQQEYPSFNDLLQFRNQYTITKNLALPGIVRPETLKVCGNSYALVMEDMDGMSLWHYVQERSLSLQEVLTIGRQLAEILHDLGQHRVIHKDIKPANILICPVSQQVKLIDFSIASLLPRETQEIQSPNVLEGTLAYLSPEQTGRMNRGIDYRSDFYSFGVTLYELLTGQLPFQTQDPIDLVHCHLAKQPIAPHTVNPNIPVLVSEIVLKLMAKNAEDRYQSALGLKYDLEQCLQQLQTTGTITAFELGQRDVSDRFIIPEKLYGREIEVQALLNAFDRVAAGRAEFMLVAGFSGIGKTAIINEVHKPIVRQRGYFIKGKFDQFNRNIPFSAFVQAFRDLVTQLLSESDAELHTWKSEILHALGENAQVIIELIPELEHLLGPQPPAPELLGTAAQNRFNLLFQRFIHVFTTAEHPLVIFVDDLQWADSASLNLMQVLMAESKTNHLLLLGAYRDNEVFAAHPLMLTLDGMAKSGASIQTITLQALSFTSLNQMIADTLHASEQVVQPLTDLVLQKTQGNPFFTTQFLKVLHQDQLITFDRDAGHWQCDIVHIRDAVLTDDVVEFMALQLQKLPESTQDILKFAACIGAEFDLATLAIVSEQSPTDVATVLWQALQEGLILPQSDIYKFYLGDSEVPQDRYTETLSYRFLHDRVQQAAYSLIAADKKSFTHWHIGNLLWQDWSAQQEDRIFDLVNQLNLGQSTISQPIQTQQLAQLNLQAAKKAKLSAAYQAAQTYCETGIALLPTGAWQTDYDLIYELHYHGSESAYLSSHFDQAEMLYQVTLKNARTPLDQAAIYRIQMTQYQLQGRNSEAIYIQRKSCQLLGWSIPTESDQIQTSLNAEIAVVNQFLEQQTIASILEKPKLVDATIEEILRILQILFYAAWLDGQSTLALLALAKMTTLSLQYGNSEMSPFGYVGYGLIANAVLKNTTQAYQFGNMAVQLCEQFDNADVRGMTNFLFAADVHSWKRPLQEADRYYEDAYKYGMDAGNWLTVSFMMMQSGSDRLTYGKNLDDLYHIAQAHAAFLQQVKSLENLDALTVGVLQPIRQLLGLTTSPLSFDDEQFSEAKYLEKYLNTPYHLAWFYSVKIRHAYLFGQVQLYSSLIPKADIIESTIPSHAKLPSTVFYVLLMHLALIESATDESQRTLHWQAIQLLEDKLRYWQQDCPENIHHKYLLVQAEKARLQGQTAEAIEYYEQSITQAQAQGYSYEAALANELAAKFWLAWGKEKVAAGYIQEAYYCYAHWGAKAKVTDLEVRYPNLLCPVLQPVETSVDILDTLKTSSPTTASIYSRTCQSSSGTSINQTFDFVAILKASQALSSTLQLDELLRQLTQIILQTSGADRCALVLPDHTDQWHVVAIATPDITELCSHPLEGNLDLPVKLIQYVKNTLETVVIDDLNTDLPVLDDYLQEQNPKSLLCLPILNQGQLIGVVYLNNRLTSGAFTRDRLLILNFLCTQAAISLENARLYTLEQQKSLQLQASELRLKTIFDKATDAILLLSNNGFIDCNQAALDLFQYPEKSQLFNLHFSTLSPEFQPDGMSSTEKGNLMISKALQFGNLRFEWLHQHSNGQDFFAEVTLTAIPYENEKILHCLVRDISDRKKLESEQQRLMNILDTTPDFIGLASVQGEILWHNKQFRNFRRDLCDPGQHNHISECHPQWSNEIIRNQGLPTAIQQGSWIGEVAILDENNQEIPVSQVIIAHKSESGEVQNFSTIMRDISDRKAVESASKAFQEKLTFLIQKTPVGIIEWNHEFKVVAWNPAAETIFGYQAEEMLDQHANQIVPESDQLHVAKVMQALLEQEGGFYSLNQNIRKDNTIITCEWINTPLRDAQGNAVGVFSMIQDVSERILAEATIRQKSQALEQTLQELQNAQLQMVQSEKMASLGNLVAGVAHEINNPIGFLNGSIDNGKDYLKDLLEHLALYQRYYPDPIANIQANAEDIDLEFIKNDFLNLLEAMQGATNRIKGISTSLRTFSRADMEHPVKANLQEGIDSTILILKYRLKANEKRPAIEVVTEYGDIPAIACFPGQLNQVFMNILANAIDALDEASQHRSFADIQANPHRITIRTSAATQQVKITITDNGPGIPDAVKAKIFDHLFTTKSVGKGTGLGLAIARQIVEETHQGRLEVASELGQGTEFGIYLPIQHE